MTTKCANPGCSSPFLYFRSGKIYLIDLAGSVGHSSQTGRGMEYFWLCGECAQTMRVALNRLGAVVVERLPEPALQAETPLSPKPAKKAAFVSAA